MDTPSFTAAVLGFALWSPGFWLMVTGVVVGVTGLAVLIAVFRKAPARIVPDVRSDRLPAVRSSNRKPVIRPSSSSSRSSRSKST